MIKDKDHRDYTNFVSEVFQCIEVLLPGQQNPLTAFCTAMPVRWGCCMQDTAMLLNDSAEFYVQVIHQNQRLFQIDPNEYVITRSIARKDEKQYIHSCYPKNVRRWLQGTLSRKKKCRVQFCTFLYCWAVGWGMPEEKHRKCQQELNRICRLHFPDIPEDMVFLPLLWMSLEAVYRK